MTPGRPSRIRQIEEQYGGEIKDILIELYEELGNQKAVADRLDISQATLSTWFARYRLKAVRILVEED